MSNSIEKLAKEAERLAKNLQENPFSAFDRIAKDIQEQKENAMAMEFTKCIGELLKKNGVVPKITEYTHESVGENSIEHRYGVSIDELDFSEHNRVFKDKIAKLEKQIKSYEAERKELRTRCCMDSAREKFDNHSYGGLVIYTKNFTSECERRLYDENQELKQRIAELENKETVELPFDALETANMLINAKYKAEIPFLERQVDRNVYGIDDLEQIAEHLLVYCKHNRESEE